MTGAFRTCLYGERGQKGFGNQISSDFIMGTTLVFPMKTEDQKSYPKIRDAFHLGFNYTIEGLRQCFCESVPDKKQTFLEDSSHLQRLFDHWIKSSNIEQSYSSL